MGALLSAWGLVSHMPLLQRVVRAPSYALTPTHALAMCFRPVCVPATRFCTTSPTTSAADPEPAASATAKDSTRLYRFAHVKALSALLRLKGLHLTAGVAVLLPAYSVVTSGGMGALGLAEVATLAAVVTGSVGAGGALSWYCERIVGEMSYQERAGLLRVSTLTMWGNRVDRDFDCDSLLRDEGFAAQNAAATGVNPYPNEGFVPLDLGGKTYIFLWGRKHVLQPDALANVLVRRALPFPPSRAPKSAMSRRMRN